MRANESDPRLTVGVEQPYLAHLVSRGNAAVAEADDGAMVGFGAAVDNGRARHLADLFVLPAAHGGGIGRRLLATVMGDAWPRTTFASDDPRALPLYVRAGMTALHPNLYLSGDARRLTCPAGYSIEPVSLERLAELELGWVGVDRRPEIPYWSTLPDPRVFVVVVGGRPVATGFARRRKGGGGRWFGHAIVAPDADPAPALLAAMAGEAGLADRTGACVLGPSPLVRILLDASFHVVDRDTYLASDPALVDPTREIVNTAFL